MATTHLKLLGLRTAIYRVSDLNKAKQWYANVLGYGPYFDEPFYVGFDVGGFELGLLPDEDAVKTKTEGVLCYWGVDDVEAVFNKLIDMGAIEHEKPTDVGGGIKPALVKDPWGNLFGIIYNPHFRIKGE